MFCNLIAWHHIRVTVPDDWEVTAYSVEDRAGRLEFSTRRGLQGVISWEPCSREPDCATTMETFLRNNILGRQLAKETGLGTNNLKTEKIGKFLLGWLDETLSCQALAYSVESKHLVRWVFEGHSSEFEKRNTVKPILESFDFNDDESCEYCLHGIHCTLPRDYKIEDMAVLPANVMMAFESENSKRRATFRRWGMASMILGNADLADFYMRILQVNAIAVDSSETCMVSGCNGRVLKYNALREHHSDRFMRRRWHNGKAVIWHDTEANRIYAFEQVGPENSKELDFTSVIPKSQICFNKQENK